MLILNPTETRRVLPYDRVVTAIQSVLRAVRTGEVQLPARQHLPLRDDGMLLVMPVADSEIAMTKLVTVHPRNTELGMDSVQGELVVMDARTGRRLLLLDGAAVTAVRTAAVSALAAGLFAPCSDGELLLIGSGVQALAHLECFATVLQTRRVHLFARNEARADAIRRRGMELGVHVERTGNPADVLPAVRMVVAATSSRTPVVPAELLPGTFVAAIGSFTRSQSELPESLILRASGRGSALIVDTPTAIDEAGEFANARIPRSSIRSLSDVVDDPPVVTEIAVFKSVGSALWDLAAAKVARNLLPAPPVAQTAEPA
jgi:ornithine cyclodeaminase